MYLLQFAGIFCIIYLIYKIKDKNNVILNKLCHIGRSSLDIYILHYFFIHVAYMKIIGNYFLKYPNFYNRNYCHISLFHRDCILFPIYRKTLERK